mmetsp:Transcript_85205/g.241451  ORF Transcript_85205/g.241451 Transcript_85205/m.241451 type:complete len:131 (+) Transcript_85205:272-664(+)
MASNLRTQQRLLEQQIDIVDSKASRVEALLRAKKEKKDAIVRARAEEKERVEEERRAKEKTKALKLGAHLAQMKELKRMALQKPQKQLPQPKPFSRDSYVMQLREREFRRAVTSFAGSAYDEPTYAKPFA